MGEFRAGVWIVVLVIYFSLFFFIATAIVEASNELGLDTDVNAQDIGLKSLGNTYGNLDTNTTIDSQGSSDDSSIRTTLSFMATFGDSINLGLPTSIAWMFAVIFFYIPAFMLGYAFYMILPWIH